MKTYTAHIERDDGHWLVEIPGLRIHTFGRSIAEAEAMALDAIAGVLDVPADDVAVELDVAEAAEEITAVHRTRKDREQAAEQEAAATRAAIRALRERGASQRDTARLLGISHQRVSQIAATLEPERSKRRSSVRMPTRGEPVSGPGAGMQSSAARSR